MVVGGVFAATSAATGSYGCEVWATPFLGEWNLLSSQCKLQGYQAAVYKRSLGVPTSTANLLTFFEMGRYPLQVHWLARTLRYWNKLVGLGQPGSSLLSGVFIANVAAGVGCNRAGTWAAQLCSALHFVCPGDDWKEHMLRFQLIDQTRVVAAAQQAFCSLLGNYTGQPAADDCGHRHFCKYATHMVQGGSGAAHDQLPLPAYVHAMAPLAHKRALAQLRLNAAPIQTNTVHGVPYSQRLCTRGCVEAVDSESHLLFECGATAAAREFYWDALELADTDLTRLMGRVYEGDYAESIMDFVHYAITLVSRPTA
jgi:hypothetical protein